MRKIYRSKIIITLSSLILLYTTIGFILLPYFIQKNFTNIVYKNIHTFGYLKRIYINPYTFEIKLTDLLVQDQKHTNLIYFHKLSLDFEFTSLFKKDLLIKRIYLKDFKTDIIFDKNKIANFQYILDTLSKNTNSHNTNKAKIKQSSIPITIKNISLINSTIKFTDNSKTTPFMVETKPFDINITNLSTVKKSQGYIKTNIMIKDTVLLNLHSNFSLNPLIIDGNIKLNNVQINKFFSYIKNSTNFNLLGGKIDLAFNYNLNLNNTINGNISDITASLDHLTFKNKNLQLGILNLSNTINNIFINKHPNKITKLTISHMNLNEKKVTFTDFTKKKPIKLALTNINVKLSNITLNRSKPIRFRLLLNTPQKGTISTHGNITIDPLVINSDLNITNMVFLPYMPYVKEFLNINIKDGMLNNNFNIKIKKINNKIYPQVYGDISLNNLNIEHSITKEQIFGLKKFKIDGLDYKFNDLNIKNIFLDEVYSTFTIKKNKTTNFDNITPKNNINKTTLKKTTKITQKKVVKKKINLKYFIQNIDLNNSHLNFADKSLPIPFNTKIDKLTANIKALSSNDIITKIDLNGIVNKYGLAKIQGDITTADFKKQSNIKVNFENLDLVKASGYSGKFLGKKIASGKLWLDLNYNIKDSNLTSTNNIRVKDLELGKKIDNNVTFNLPIGLAVALLEDSDGFIEIDVPIDGDIDNPNFNLAPAIWSAVGNIIKNIITSPFRFLASLLGSDTDELGKIEFDYGSSNLLVTQLEKLDKLLSILSKKHKLGLKLNPIYNKIFDTKILKNSKFIKLTNKKNKAKIISNMYISKFSKKEYEKLFKQYKKKPNKLIKLLSKQLIPTMNISQEDLENLAKNRVKSIKTYLIKKGLNKSRITITQKIKEISNKKKRVTLNMDIEISK